MHDTIKRQSAFRLAQSSELQGLRALAVTAVFLYHFDSAVLPSGFTGVDIFFVLSGFLIGRKLLAELDETGKVDVLRFAAARAKRLLPNATLALVATAIASWLLLPPYRFSDIANDIFAAALFFSNFHFASSAIDYLRIGSPPSPVLHFWSLSIEEQFYLGLPALLLAIGTFLHRGRISVAIAVIGLIALLSFAFGWNALSSSQPAAFFQSQNRIWQLAVGIVVGYAVARSRFKLRASSAALLATLALAGLVWSLTMMTGAYPGPAALWPTLSTSAFLVLIFSGRDTVLHRVLRLRPVQWVGDRSYSLYLWHWPFLTIAAQTWPSSGTALLFAACCSIVVAHLVYEWVEQPVRSLRYRAKGALPAIAGVISIAVIASAGLRHAPIPEVAEDRLAEITRASSDFGKNYSNGCHLSGLEDIASPPCEFGDTTSGRTVMLFGDSHAARWFEPVRQAAEQEGWRFVTRTKTSCPAAQVDMWYPPRQAPYLECATWRDTVMREIASDPPRVLIVASFADYRGWIERGGSPVDAQEGADLLTSGFRSMALSLPSETHLFSIRDNPQMFTDFMACLSYGDDCSRPRREALSGLVDDRHVAAGAGREIEVLDFTDHACSALECSPLLNGEIIYQDFHHYTSSYTSTFADEFASILKAYTTQGPATP